MVIGAATRCRRRVVALEGQAAHLPLLFALEAALGEQNQIVDRLSDRGDGPHLEDSWHRLTGGNSISCFATVEMSCEMTMRPWSATYRRRAISRSRMPEGGNRRSTSSRRLVVDVSLSPA